MGPKSVQDLARAAWALARRQHWVVTRRQLLDLGVHLDAIDHRLAVGRLHRVHTGVYAVGRPELTRLGELMAAVLACGQDAVLSGAAAAELWDLGGSGQIEVTVPTSRRPRRPGIAVRRRDLPVNQIALRRGISVTTPFCTLVDLAADLPADRVERAVNDADKLDLIDPEELRAQLDAFAGRSGVQALTKLLDHRTFTLTDSELERRFLPIAKSAGLPLPLTRVRVNGFMVDFFWPGLGLVVETDGLRYHRTPAQQAGDRRRDQVHTAAGLTALRFTHAQVRWERRDVEGILAAVAQRLGAT